MAASATHRKRGNSCAATLHSLALAVRAGTIECTICVPINHESTRPVQQVHTARKSLFSARRSPALWLLAFGLVGCRQPRLIFCPTRRCRRLFARPWPPRSIVGRLSSRRRASLQTVSRAPPVRGLYFHPSSFPGIAYVPSSTAIVLLENRTWQSSVYRMPPERFRRSTG